MSGSGELTFFSFLISNCKQIRQHLFLQRGIYGNQNGRILKKIFFRSRGGVLSGFTLGGFGGISLGLGGVECHCQDAGFRPTHATTLATVRNRHVIPLFHPGTDAFAVIEATVPRIAENGSLFLKQARAVLEFGKKFREGTAHRGMLHGPAFDVVSSSSRVV